MIPDGDVRELREMLRSMQEGEMTVSRGIELIEMWLAGNYSDDQLPPINNDLGEDQWPMEELRKTRAEVERLIDYNAAQANALEMAKVALNDKQWSSDGDVFAHNQRVQEALAAIEALPAAPKGGA